MWHISDFGSVKQKDILWHAVSAVSSLENLEFMHQLKLKFQTLLRIKLFQESNYITNNLRDFWRERERGGGYMYMRGGAHVLMISAAMKSANSLHAPW